MPEKKREKLLGNDVGLSNSAHPDMAYNNM